jgi:hypothetical protein
LEAAHQAAFWDDYQDDRLHPIRYGAAAAVLITEESGEDENEAGTHDVLEYWQAHQLKAMEYGSSEDPVCQLVARANRFNKEECCNKKNNNMKKRIARVVAVAQVDQYGVPHAPFGAARALLVEHGHGGAHVVVTFETLAAAAPAANVSPAAVTTAASSLEAPAADDPLAAILARDESSGSLPSTSGGRRDHWLIDDEGEDDDLDAATDRNILPPTILLRNLSACAVQARELAPFVPVIRHGGGSGGGGRKRE